MNSMQTRHLVRNFWRLALIVSLLGPLVSIRAAEPAVVPTPAPAPALVQGERFLLIFETSRGLKKNLPAVRQEIAQLFSSNLQNEIEPGDDLAVWTVDESLHTGSFPLANWMPEGAEECARHVDGFLAEQKFTRHASLAAVQPQLNRLVKHSERLTVIIFCDSQSRLVGTPYDSGVNEIITNAAAKIKGDVVPFILVLRSSQGEYIGCSVNRASRLSFPNYPAPPKPTPPPAPAPLVAKPAPVAPPVTGPIVTPVPALIIVGTKASTNIEAAAKLTPPSPGPTSAAVPASIIVSNVPPAVVASAPNPPPPVTLPAAPTPTPTTTPATIPAPAPAPAPEAAPKVVSLPPSTPSVAPTPVSTPVAPAAVVAKTPSPAPETISKQVVAAPVTPPPALEAKPVEAVVETGSSGRGFLIPLAVGGVALVGAAALVTWLMLRSRRPTGSLITSSLQNDPRLPPRK